MLKRFIILLVLSMCITGFITRAQTLTAKDIITRCDDKSRGKTSQGEMTMTIVRPTWSRSITMKSWEKNNGLALILITAPAKDKGQVFLKIKTEMWNWLPSIERMIKIPPSMMLQSWMGSDFTNDDLIKESSIVKDYTHKLLGQETVRDMPCYKIEMTPVPEAPITWGKVITWITVKDFNQWKAEYYDEDMSLINVLNASNIKRMSDREVPTLLEIVPIDKKNNKTILEIKNVIYDQPIKDSFFSQQNMRSVGQRIK
ncbi:outer membrane lipoprotein-sorting protein [uncultured Bacteroides sp.]|uniref:outer membrane lipoprotein-sorting protein n=1 Tax=uncultured Bacteroides sp. TaxID=162156 RepID=UPI002AAAD0E3|nr:outer membrane lipoprotein-sorting protein [uncultured Bacteroides sp.]